ncbi:hypothetical protein [Flavobacterium reichenbachii]|uniref:Uncharacterized protein n=1 Tax=Flavobacterium reichenbachii TaxID=362418 RepID=A0A085ZIK8_9FLAO|nr:hypothetical protein [Flavobacterium reichenbachii]KFF04272.1 hypothetical protein IW19_01460 [Flavobacterium reichenbachii]OXB13832.1 hypothetical protein B0A68_13860 [Flavobacterium reichenbachii]
MKHIDRIGNLLPLGYVILVMIGIIRESVFFYQIGINILKYSSIMDILISPLATLTSHPIVLAAIILMIILHFKLPDLLQKNDHKNWVRRLFELDKIKDKISQEEQKNYYIIISIKTFFAVFFSFFLGFGIADGYAVSNKIKNNELDYDCKLNFNTGESEDVFLINTNTEYYFFVTKGSQTIKIAPIGSIKSIELTKNRALNKSLQLPGKINSRIY